MATQLQELFSLARKQTPAPIQAPTQAATKLSRSKEEMTAHAQRVAASDAAAKHKLQAVKPGFSQAGNERMMSEEEKGRIMVTFAKNAMATFYKSSAGAPQLENLFKKLSTADPKSLEGRKAAILKAMLSAGPRMANLPLGLIGGVDLKKLIGESVELKEKAKSKSQQRFMGMVHACKTSGKCASDAVKKVAKSISGKEAKKFAETKTKGLPERIKEGAVPGLPNVVGNMSKWLEKKDKKEMKKKSKVDTPYKGSWADQMAQKKKKKIKEGKLTFKGFLIETHSFKAGDKVKRTHGILKRGIIINRFPWKESTDGTDKAPRFTGKGYTPVKWNDGTRGYIFNTHLEKE